ncbi:hypothetical protein [Flavobacterium sp. 3HN19-14]|uniref:hypothetical protein n=1 Tax=Flavobacterium sp. 3HN19-14 TaxID=3448133 RepID=UPI003EDF0E77
MTFNCEQIAGFAQLDFYLLSESSNWPIVLTDLNAGQIVIEAEVYGVDAEIVDDSINIDVNPKYSSEGTIFPIDASFKCITRSESIEQMFEQYANKPGFAIARLNNGFQKLYGSNEEPIYLRWRNDDGQKVDDPAGVIINIKGEQRSRPVFYAVADSE